MSARAKPGWRWRGRHVKLVDGTGISMPDTPENQACYPQPSSQAEGVGFPLARVVGVICLATGAVIDAAIGPHAGKGSSELGLLRTLGTAFSAGDVMLADAFYGAGVRGVAEGQGQPSPWSALRNEIYLGGEQFVHDLLARLDGQELVQDIPKAQRRALSRPLDEYARLHHARNVAMAAAYRSGDYTLQQIGMHFGVHYSRVSRIVHTLRGMQAKASSDTEASPCRQKAGSDTEARKRQALTPRPPPGKRQALTPRPPAPRPPGPL